MPGSLLDGGAWARDAAPLEGMSVEAGIRFDGRSSRANADGPPPVSAQPGGGDSGGWSPGSFESPVDGALLHFRRRAAQTRKARPPMVFVGGLGLAESFDALFAAAPARSEQIFLWLRGHQPSAWAPARHPLDADARDLARMIVTAARDSGSSQVELSLHSYASLVLQRMVQLDEPEVREALELLRGSRIFILNGTTHFKGSESAAGPEYEKMTRATALFVSWLDMMDETARLWRQIPVLNPYYGTARIWLAAWELNRRQALDAAAKPVVEQLREHLKGPWAPEVEETRRAAVRRLEANAHDDGWQEALVRRVNDGALLEAQPADISRLAALGVRISVVVSAEDQIIPWSVSKLFLEHLGVAAPETAPPAGTVLESRDGVVRAVVVAGDHYVPLKDPGAVDRLLSR